MQRLTPERLEEILQRASEHRVVVLGDAMLDVYLTGSVQRISPEAPVPVVQVEAERVALGGAANVAANVAALGVPCDLLGVIGTDPAGIHLRSELAGYGERLRARLLEAGDRPTTTKTRVMARHQQVVRYDRERDHDLTGEDEATLSRWLRDTLAGASALVLQDYNKGVLTSGMIRTALRIAAEADIPTVVDPKRRGFFAYAGATVFKPNALELADALGAPNQPQDDGWLESARRRLGCSHLLLTLGEEGMVLRSEQGSSLRVPAVAREVYDVSGAGDTVSACVAVALAAGAEMEEAAVLANFAAAVEVGKPGVGVVTPDELRDAVAARERLTAVAPTNLSIYA